MGIDARPLPNHLLPSPDWSEGTWWNPAGYRSARVRARIMYVMMALEALLALTMLIVYAVSFDQLVDYMVRAGSPQFGLTSFDVLTVALGALTFPVFIGRIVAQLAWLSRSVDNSWYLLGGTPKWSPGWSIGWWFIPGANLVLPFLVVRDLNRRMAKGVGRPLFGLLLTWWLSGFVLGMTIYIWYMAVFFQALIPELARDPNAIPVISDATATTLAWLSLAMTGAGLIPTALTFLVYRRIQGFAEAREPHAVPPPPPALYTPPWPSSQPGAWGPPAQEPPPWGAPPAGPARPPAP